MIDQGECAEAVNKPVTVVGSWLPSRSAREGTDNGVAVSTNIAMPNSLAELGWQRRNINTHRREITMTGECALIVTNVPDEN